MLATGKSVWSGGTAGNPGVYAQLGTDGDLVVHTTTGTTWATGLTATTGVTFQPRDDSTADVVNGDAVLWHKGTAGCVPAADGHRGRSARRCELQGCFDLGFPTQISTTTPQTSIPGSLGSRKRHMR